MVNQNLSFSRSGFTTAPNFDYKIYLQGGLDCYCGFYSIWNLINYLKYIENGSKDFIGSDDFAPFKKMIKYKPFEAFAKKNVFGGEGINASCLLPILEGWLKTLNINATLRIEEDLSIHETDSKNNKGHLRIGVDKYFADENEYPIIGLACIWENKHDVMQHWVAFIETDYKENNNLRKGYILDSDRGYTRWEFDGDCLRIFRKDEPIKHDQIFWISSFISVNLLNSIKFDLRQT